MYSKSIGNKLCVVLGNTQCYDAVQALNLYIMSETASFFLYFHECKGRVKIENMLPNL